MPTGPRPKRAGSGGWSIDRTFSSRFPRQRPLCRLSYPSLADGISVNVTLIFSVERYKAVLESFLSGLEKCKASGRSLTGIESVASFFISRVDTETDRRLAEVEAKGGEDRAAAKRLHGLAAIANARPATKYMKTCWTRRVAGIGGKRRAPAAAALGIHGVKDKTFSDSDTSSIWVVPDTVITMPAATLQAIADHGVVRGDTVRRGYDGAWDTMDELGRLGIYMADVAATLERQGLATFVKSWNELIGSVTEKLESQGASVVPKAPSGLSPAQAKPRQSRQPLPV